MKYEDLEVWQRSYKLAVTTYRSFTSLRDYGFKDQITRSALSIPSNIAEGWERISDREKVRFLSYAKGSCGELKTQLMIARDVRYLEAQTALSLVDETEQIGKMLGALISRLS